MGVSTAVSAGNVDKDHNFCLTSLITIQCNEFDPTLFYWDTYF